MRRQLALIALLVVGVALVAACGSEDDTAAPPAPAAGEPPPPEPAPEPAVPAPAEPEPAPEPAPPAEAKPAEPDAPAPSDNAPPGDPSLTLVSANESFEFGTGDPTPENTDDVFGGTSTIHERENGPAVGGSSYRCDGTGPAPEGPPSDVCVTVVALEDGDLWLANWFSLDGLPESAVLGGTGAHTDASGVSTLSDLSGQGTFDPAELALDLRPEPAATTESQLTVVAVNEAFDMSGDATPEVLDNVAVFAGSIHESEDGPEIGRYAFRCSSTGPFESELPNNMCLEVHVLPDGDLWAAGRFAESTPASAVLGGTGAYVHASGEWTVTDERPDGTADWAFDLGLKEASTDASQLTLVAATESSESGGADTAETADDLFIFEATVHEGEDGPRVGRSAGHCGGTATGPEGSPVQLCLVVVSLEDGDLWYAGWTPSPGELPATNAILGGTGAYAHASGVMSLSDLGGAADAPSFELAFEILQ